MTKATGSPGMESLAKSMLCVSIQSGKPPPLDENRRQCGYGFFSFIASSAFFEIVQRGMFFKRLVSRNIGCRDNDFLGFSALIVMTWNHLRPGERCGELLHLQWVYLFGVGKNENDETLDPSIAWCSYDPYLVLSIYYIDWIKWDFGCLTSPSVFQLIEKVPAIESHGDEGRRALIFSLSFQAHYPSWKTTTTTTRRRRGKWYGVKGCLSYLKVARRIPNDKRLETKQSIDDCPATRKKTLCLFCTGSVFHLVMTKENERIYNMESSMSSQMDTDVEMCRVVGGSWICGWWAGRRTADDIKIEIISSPHTSHLEVMVSDHLSKFIFSDSHLSLTLSEQEVPSILVINSRSLDPFFRIENHTRRTQQQLSHGTDSNRPRRTNKKIWHHALCLDHTV